MNRFALVGATIALLVCAAVAAAATPLPSKSPQPSASPAPSPMPSPAASASASPSPSTSPSPSASSSTTAQSKQPQTWTADVNPVNIEGTATLTANADGTGKLVLQLTGMVNEQNWTVDVEPGAIQHPNDGVTIAFKQGSDVEKVAPDKIQVRLTSAEMDAFNHALKDNPGGATIFVSDGHRLSAATLTGSQQ